MEFYRSVLFNPLEKKEVSFHTMNTCISSPYQLVRKDNPYSIRNEINKSLLRHNPYHGCSWWWCDFDEVGGSSISISWSAIFPASNDPVVHFEPDHNLALYVMFDKNEMTKLFIQFNDTAVLEFFFKSLSWNSQFFFGGRGGGGDRHKIHLSFQS